MAGIFARVLCGRLCTYRQGGAVRFNHAGLYTGLYRTCGRGGAMSFADGTRALSADELKHPNMCERNATAPSAIFKIKGSIMRLCISGKRFFQMFSL
jgi:hypothetical protein